uniref:Tc1-like transposase DDE domain-containing protein n=1 Tax=Oryzias latipes TaxID=8090 RepID=A0A3P9LGN6_ORYLA
MDDNAPPHGARIVPAGFQKVGVSHVVWPTMTSDLNPIEHVWDHLGRNTRRRCHALTAVNGENISFTHCE